MKKIIKDCDENLSDLDGIPISNHDFIETYNDGKMQVLKCQICGHESVGWNRYATTDIV